MSILVIENDPCLTIEYSPTLVETTLELILHDHGNALRMAKYGVDYRIGDEADPQVFSFFRDAIKPIKGLRLDYEKQFNGQASRKTLNHLIRNFDKRSIFSEIISIEDNRKQGLYLEFLGNYKGEFRHYNDEEVFPLPKALKRIWDEFSRFCPEQIKENTRGFEWKDQTIPFYLENYIDVILGKNRITKRNKS